MEVNQIYKKKWC